MSEEKPTILHLLRHHASLTPAATAIVQESSESQPHELAYGRLWDRVRVAASQVVAQSEPGDRAVLLFPAGAEFVEAFLGCILARRIAVPASIPRNERAIERTMAIVRDSEARLVVTTPELMPKLQMVLRSSRSTEDTAPTIIAIEPDGIAPYADTVDCVSSDVAFLQYTSGSTSNPKGVMVPHASLSDNLTRIRTVFAFDESTRLVNWLPVHHDMGLIGGILTPLSAGRSTVLMSPMEFLQRPIRWLELVTRHRGTISGAPNFAYDACVTRVTEEQMHDLDLSSWRVAFNGSEPVRAATFERFVRKFERCGFEPGARFPCYGLAESTLLVAGRGSAPYATATFDRGALKKHQIVVTNDEKGRTLVGCGSPIDGHEVAIVDSETRARCNDNEVGEIWISGPSVCGGYWAREEETAAVFSAQVRGEESRRFLKTGDLGFIHDGQLYISGRLKNIVIIRGLNFACEDIEDLSQGSHPAIAGAPCAAFGVEGRSGEELVVLQEINRAHMTSFDSAEIIGSIQESIVLNHGTRANNVVLVEPRSLPRTTSGKIQRPRARDLYLSGQIPCARMPTSA